MVEEGQEIRDETRAARTAGGVSRVTEAAVIEQDDFVAAGKGRNLVEPAGVIAADAVRKDKRVSLAMHFIIELESIDVECCHVFPRCLLFSLKFHERLGTP